MFRTLIIAVIAFVIDQFSKWYVVFYLELNTKYELDVFPPFLNFRMGWNYGVNFGLFSNDNDAARWVLIGLAVAISVGLFWYSRRFSGWWGPIFVGSIIGGALANVLDRIIYGAVADFLNMSCCGINNPFAFNVADIFIFFGAFGLIIFSEKLDNRA